MDAAGNRVALVSGSSLGLGRAIVRRLARDGMSVAVNGRRDDGQAREVARAIRGDGGVADAFYADVTDEQQVTNLITAVADLLGPVDVLVLNATGPQPPAPRARRVPAPPPAPRSAGGDGPRLGPVRGARNARHLPRNQEQ